MKDQKEREIDYLRISVTDRCNLRCTYCMPEDGVEPVGHDKILRFSEIESVCRCAASLGVKKIKLTGGEPLVRRGIISLVKMIRDIPGIEEVTITTNGVLLAEMYEDLVDAGLTSVTVSLDTLNRERFEKLTRRDELERVLAGLRKATEAGRIPVKINCVAMKETSMEEFLQVAALAKEHPIHVRFIEMMPIGMGRECAAWTEGDLRSALAERFGEPVPYEGRLGNGPAKYVSLPGFAGKIGFISAISHVFCDKCNRVRLTSEGFLKSCLQYDVGVDLRPYLADDEELTEAIRRGIHMKPERHSFGEKQIENEEQRRMSQIGG